MDKDVQKRRFVPEVFPVKESKIPALQVEQVKRGCFEGSYEDNAWKNKPFSNLRNRGKTCMNQANSFWS
jgi:hypothetical protein